MVQAVSPREQIQNDLIAIAEQHIANWDNYADRETTSNQYGFEFASRQTDYENCVMTVAKASVPGLTLEQHRAFRDNLATQQAKIEDKLTVVEIPDVDGHKALIHHIKMPMMMSNRSVVQIYYVKECEDGSLIFISSSRNTDEVVAAQAKIIKKNVVANNMINYQKLTPTEGGCDWVSVQCFDLAGSIPSAIANQGASRQAVIPEKLIYLIKTGNAPPS